MTEFLQALLYNPHHALLFHSVLFFILFSVFYLFYAIAFNNIKARNTLLLLFSLYFYYKISGIAVVLLLIISSSDYLIGKGIFRMRNNPWKPLLLLLALLVDLGCLIYFKYANFFLQAWAQLTEAPQPAILQLIVTVGISYFVFKSLSYIFDLYRGNIETPEKNCINYVLYVSFFPNILAGPISKAIDLLPQIRGKLFITNENVSKGFFLIMCGAFKKIFIADFLAGNFVDRVFDAPAYFSGFESLVASYGYTIQLYFDFSGYTDIVIGIACLLGFSLLPNFNKPFLATNVTDFWRRWHLTLSAWLRDYLFAPLSLQLRWLRTFGVMLAIIITFLICGFWHDAKYTFIIWGGLHGLAMAWDILTHKIRNKIKKKVNSGIYRFISILITFHFVCFAFIIFRVADIPSAIKMYEKIFTSVDFSLFGQWLSLYMNVFMVMVLGLALHYTPLKWNEVLVGFFGKLHWSLKTLVVFAAFIVIYQVFSSQAQPFIYLEF